MSEYKPTRDSVIYAISEIQSTLRDLDSERHKDTSNAHSELSNIECTLESLDCARVSDSEYSSLLDRVRSLRHSI